MTDADALAAGMRSAKRCPASTGASSAAWPLHRRLLLARRQAVIEVDGGEHSANVDDRRCRPARRFLDSRKVYRASRRCLAPRNNDARHRTRTRSDGVAFGAAGIAAAVGPGSPRSAPARSPAAAIAGDVDRAGRAHRTRPALALRRSIVRRLICSIAPPRGARIRARQPGGLMMSARSSRSMRSAARLSPSGFAP